ncbi:hypothetical protein TNCV_3146381 [Trichonephila clavipes]|nr:hypothetical protein TNCV_3146381 [Trichonephila clavipes]
MSSGLKRSTITRARQRPEIFRDILLSIAIVASDHRVSVSIMIATIMMNGFRVNVPPGKNGDIKSFLRQRHFSPNTASPRHHRLCTQRACSGQRAFIECGRGVEPIILDKQDTI